MMITSPLAFASSSLPFRQTVYLAVLSRPSISLLACTRCSISSSSVKALVAWYGEFGSSPAASFACLTVPHLRVTIDFEIGIRRPLFSGFRSSCLAQVSYWAIVKSSESRAAAQSRSA